VGSIVNNVRTASARGSIVGPIRLLNVAVSRCAATTSL
jgi:hypothetical protein